MDIELSMNNPFFMAVVLLTLSGPVVAGIIMTIFVYGKNGLNDIVSRLFRWRVAARWYAAAILTPLLSVFGTLFVLSLFSPAFIPGILTAGDKVSLVLSAVIIGLIGALCEETGWTGFAIPQLRKSYGILATGVLVGILWGAWHFLSNLFGASISAGAIPLILFMPVILFSFLPPFRLLMVWVYDHTKSLLLAIIMHSSLIAFWIIATPTGIAGANLVTWYIAWAVVLWIIAGVISLKKKK
jgi:membrane protease YdiL (CAAX protease family)